ncbi:cupin domain-containing protein [Rhodococcus sp. NCIMB 12038]|uniref:cupin domain-containing protein n=1 Tax=Rhodococcus sp. NCIMB 12038 TaxID=933800 RepID=UPI000B3BF9A7|nr:cupin domain-containing protein [Rhodococcus sp. NCIMB 12038]OUS91372.1 cupin [Rhodococcus sp. NCIMB 12038]
MKLIHGTEQAGTAGKTGSQFTGTVYNYLTMPGTDGVTINTVTFTPGARTFWHSHEHGQILQVLAGEGLVGTEAEGIRTLKAGDTVWCPPGERHWHGGAPGAFMTHTAISLGRTEWESAVADDEYAATALQAPSEIAR